MRKKAANQIKTSLEHYFILEECTVALHIELGEIVHPLMWNVYYHTIWSQCNKVREIIDDYVRVNGHYVEHQVDPWGIIF